MYANGDGDVKSGNDRPPRQRLEPERASTRRLDVWKYGVPAGTAVVGVIGVVVSLLVFLFGTDVVGRQDGDEMADGARNGAAQTESSEREPRLYATYSFKKAPFVHPKIINEFVGRLSDVGDQVVAINLLDSAGQQSLFRRDFGHASA